ncbi:unnamed protein product [Alternaria alternata]
MARDRLPYDGGQTALLDEGSDGFGPSPSMPSYSEDSDRGEVIASDLGPMLLPSWSFQDAPNPPMTPGPLGPQEACLIRCFAQELATTFEQGRGLGQALPSLFTPLPIFQPNHLSANIAAYLVALRMEIWAVLLYQRPIRLPLPSFKDCRHVHDGEIDDDYLWTRRVLVWCAHVLKLHFGSDGFDVSDDGYASASELWGALKAFEFDWDTRPPSCFQPLYSRQNAPQQGRYFPELWLANPCQVMALQHIEFGRMMLANHEAQLQNRRLGGDELASQASEALFLHSMRTICGLAACHSDRHEALTAAAVAISMCGKYVRDAGERSALMSILHKLRTDFAWNISHAVNALNGGAGDATQGDLRT